ncbi:hypothetical protein ACIBF1_18040 [Spirillospora sp. NPDC050679]
MKRTTIVLALTAALGVALTGCGGSAGSGGEQDKEQVATLTTPSAPAEKRTAAEPDDAGAPRLRLDSTREEVDRLNGPWLACLKAKGVPFVTENGGGPGPMGTGQEAAPSQDDRWTPQYRACQSKHPLPPWEMDDKNPKAADGYHRWVACMNREGLKVRQGPGPTEWTYADGNTKGPDESARIEQACKMEAFRGQG